MGLRRAFSLTLLAGLLVAPGPVWAQGAPGLPRTDAGSLIAERARLRGDLDRVNQEIETLKREGRSLRGDYRLRDRMAEAETIARRMTEIDARLRTLRPAAGPVPMPPGPGAQGGRALDAEPGDGPADLEAKADTLADQARALAREAQTLSDRAGRLRGRQELRRRVGQMERDPFAGLESSKRRSLTVTPAPGNTGGGDKSAGGSAVAPGAGPSVGGAGPTANPPADTPASVKERELLDPATLAELRKLESQGSPGTDAQALDKAAAALRDRAARLESQAKALRDRARR